MKSLNLLIYCEHSKPKYDQGVLFLIISIDYMLLKTFSERRKTENSEKIDRKFCLSIDVHQWIIVAENNSEN